MPFGVKDLEDCEGMPTTHGSLLFAGRGPVAEDELTVARLRAAGAVPVGKTAAPEFGTLSFTKTKVFGVTRNPWDLTRTPGGSSGGSSAAVAAGIVPFATASDGGGSIRIPAAFTGLVGHKPSYGRVASPAVMRDQTSVHGLADDDRRRHGPHPRRAWRAPTIATACRCRRPAFATRTRSRHGDVSGLRARWSPDLGFASPDPEVLAIAEDAARALADAAGLVLDTEPVHLTDPVRTWLSGGAITLWVDIERDMWPAGADDFTYYVRQSLEATEGHTLARYTSACCDGGSSSSRTAPRSSATSTCCSPRRRRCRPFAAEGPPPDARDVDAVHDAREPVLEPGDVGPRRD